MQDLAANRRPEQDRHGQNRCDEEAVAHVLNHGSHRHFGMTAMAHHFMGEPITMSWSLTRPLYPWGV